VENDLQLRGSYESSPPCTWFDTLFSQENMGCAMLSSLCQNLMRIFSCHQSATHNETHLFKHCHLRVNHLLSNIYIYIYTSFLQKKSIQQNISSYTVTCDLIISFQKPKKTQGFAHNRKGLSQYCHLGVHISVLVHFSNHHQTSLSKKKITLIQ